MLSPGEPMWLEVIGWIGAIAFALSAVPQAVKSWKDKHSHGLAWSFLGLWLLGELASIVYVLPKGHIPLLANYFLNLTFLLVIIWYKVRPRA